MAENRDEQGLRRTPFIDDEYDYRFSAGDTIVGRYSVVRALGHGGFSEVYLCSDSRLGREVALKVIPKDRLSEEMLLEAQIAASLEHSNIVQIYDRAESGDDPFFITMRFVPGGTLQERLDRAQYQRLGLNAATLQILSDIASALDHAHGQGVLHRDVKPSNILVSEDGRAVLADFGLAQTKRLPGESALSAGTQLSGTIPYLSPEQVKEQKVDHRSDIYALGVVAYQALTGQLPYRGHATALLVNIANTPPVPPRVANAEIPEGVEKVLLKVLSKQPGDRHGSCGEFVRELREVAQAYTEMSSLYDRAMESIEEQQWSDALEVLAELEKQAPGYKDVRLHITQVSKQVQLQDLLAEARTLLRQEDYQGCLDKLNAISGLDPEYDVAGMREQAQAGVARLQRETLDRQYERACKQFAEEEYRACLDTLAVIHEQDADYPDPEGLREKAEVALQRRQEIASLYSSSQEHGQAGEWDRAVLDLEKLQQKEPNYPGIDTLLTTARYMARLTGILQRAQERFGVEDYAACVDELDELTRIDPQHRQVEVSALRQQAIGRLYNQAVRYLEDFEFERALETVGRVGPRDPEYGDPERVVEKAENGIIARERRAKLDGWYEEARAALSSHQYEAALKQWNAIAVEDPTYRDRVDVRGQALGGWCHQLDAEARIAYDNRQYTEAVTAWEQIQEIDPRYPIPTSMYERARNPPRGVARLFDSVFGRPSLDRSPAEPESATEAPGLSEHEPVVETDQVEAGRFATEPEADLVSETGAVEREQPARQPEPELTDLSVLEPEQPATEPRLEAVAETGGVPPEPGAEAPGPPAPESLIKVERVVSEQLESAIEEDLGEPEQPEALPTSEELAVKAEGVSVGAGEEREPGRPQAATELWVGIRRALWPWGAIVGGLLIVALLGWGLTPGGFLRQPTATPSPTVEFVATPTVTDTPTSTPTPTNTPTATPELDKTLTAKANVKATAEANVMATAEAKATATAAANKTATAEAKATATAIANATATTKADATATAEALKTATANRDASVLPAPVYVPDSQLTYLKPGDTVTVLGRAPVGYGEWFYVKTAGDVEGYAYAPYFDWSGNFDKLDEVEPKTPVPTTPPISGLQVSAGTLRIVHVWPNTLCTQGGWTAYFEVKIDGGDGRSYTLYWDEEQIEYKVKESEKDVAIVQRLGAEGLLVGTIKVKSGGQEASQQVSARPPNCQ